MDKLKSALLNHGEKIVAVVFVLLGFMALTSANWSPETRNPEQIVDTTEKAKAQIAQNQWPEGDQKLFTDIADVENMVRNNSKILTKAEDFQIGSYNPSIRRVKAMRTGVVVLAPESPRAISVVFPLAMPPEEEDEEAEEDGTEEEDEKSEEEMTEEEQFEKLVAEKLGLRQGAGGADAGYPGGGLDGYPGGGGLAGDAGYPEGYGDDSQSEMESMYGGGGYEDGSAGELMGQYGTEMMSVKKNVRVSAGVAVTMVVDLRKQREGLRTSLHLPSDYRVAQAMIQYVDLMVERRRKQGPDVWDQWERVSSEDLGEILKESFGIDRDIVSPAVTRNTITMPLPRRAAGDWSADQVSHPRVENFELSPEEKILMDKWNQRVTEKLATIKEEQPEEVEQKGFSQFVQSSTDAGMMMMGGSYGGGMDNYESGSGGEYGAAYDYSDFAEGMGEGKSLTEAERQLLDETKATADHRLLLVRFMDFTIERGFAYQYRVRLEMKNPNYNHPLDELVDPALSVEPTLFSEWSEATPETFVPVAHRTYLTGVDARDGIPEKVGISVYTDTTDTGMPVMGSLKSVMMGLPIAGKENIEIVDLTTEEVAQREVSLRTNELLTAAQEMPRVSTSDHEHAALKAAISQMRGRVVPDQVCVVDGDGGLILRSVGENRKQQKYDETEASTLLKIYDAWKKKKVDNSFFGPGGDEGGYGDDYAAGGLGMGYGAAAAGGYYGGGGGSQDTGSGRSSRKRR